MPVSLPQMLYKVIQIDADQVHDYLGFLGSTISGVAISGVDFWGRTCPTI